MWKALRLLFAQRKLPLAVDVTVNAVDHAAIVQLLIATRATTFDDRLRSDIDDLLARFGETQHLISDVRLDLRAAERLFTVIQADEWKHSTDVTKIRDTIARYADEDTQLADYLTDRLSNVNAISGRAAGLRLISATSTLLRDLSFLPRR